MKYIILVFIFTLFSCNDNLQKRELIKEPMINEFRHSNVIIKSITDTLLFWKSDSINSVKYFYNSDCKILNEFVINQDSNLIFTYLISRDTGYKNSVLDYQYDLGGAKINGKWYFFFGATTAIDRASYQDSIYSPMTFDELSYLARENLSGALYQNESGEVKVRESFFDFMDDPNGWGLPAGSTRKDIDSVIVARNKEMRQYKIDLKEIEQIKAEMAKSVRPKEPIPDLKWYKKNFPKEKKLFETDEWKEYVKSKNQKNESN
jgi:hypothetical protein